MRSVLRVAAVALTLLVLGAGSARAAVPLSLEEQVPAPSPDCVDAVNYNPAEYPKWVALSQRAQAVNDLLNVGIVNGQVVHYRISQLQAVSAGPTHQVILPDGPGHFWIWYCPV